MEGNTADSMENLNKMQADLQKEVDDIEKFIEEHRK